MPFVKVEIFSGKSKEYKKKLLDSIHDALVEAFKILKMTGAKAL